MVDFRINMVGTAGKDYSTASCVLKILQYLFALFGHIGSEGLLFCPCLVSGITDLLYGNIGEFFGKDLHKTVA